MIVLRQEWKLTGITLDQPLLLDAALPSPSHSLYTTHTHTHTHIHVLKVMRDFILLRFSIFSVFSWNPCFPLASIILSELILE